MKRKSVLKMGVNITSLTQAANKIEQWAKAYQSAYVCVSNVHMCMEVYDNSAFADIVNAADKVIPDGKPITLGLKLLGHTEASQVRGADITLTLCEMAASKGLVIGLYGGEESVLADFSHFLKTKFPDINIGCAISPPFRELSAQEDADMVAQINQAKVQILFVGLGCPKQERWMAAHKGQVNAVMLGVGAVFDFLSGHKKEAPRWVQSIGMEWFFRLVSEPRRLWKRYFYTNTKFIVLLAIQLFSKRLFFGNKK